MSRSLILLLCMIALFSVKAVAQQPHILDNVGASIYCGVGFDLEATIKENTFFGDNLLLDQIDCQLLSGIASDNLHIGQYQKAYDTARYVIEQCPHNPAVSGYFTTATSAAFGIYRQKDNPQIFVDYRDWLKKVLYLNENPNYYCADVRGLLVSMNYFPGRGADFNGITAILNYVANSGKCPREYWGNFDELIKSNYDTVYHIWQDTVKDSIATPLDTTIPTIEELDLTILYGPNNGAVSPAKVDTDAITSFTATANPINNETELRYSIASTAGLKVEIFDLLGNQVYTNSIGFRTQGDYSIKLTTTGWTSGTYYVRLSSMAGGVKSIKLVKE